MNKEKQNAVWQLQEAKAMLSEVVRSAAEEPQIITVRGKETAVVFSIEEYTRLKAPKQTLYEFIQDSPLRNVKLKFPQRLQEKMRGIDL